MSHLREKHLGVKSCLFVCIIAIVALILLPKRAYAETITLDCTVSYRKDVIEIDLKNRLYKFPDESREGKIEELSNSRILIRYRENNALYSYLVYRTDGSFILTVHAIFNDILGDKPSVSKGKCEKVIKNAF